MPMGPLHPSRAKETAILSGRPVFPNGFSRLKGAMGEDIKSTVFGRAFSLTRSYGFSLEFCDYFKLFGSKNVIFIYFFAQFNIWTASWASSMMIGRDAPPRASWACSRIGRICPWIIVASHPPKTSHSEIPISTRFMQNVNFLALRAYESTLNSRAEKILLTLCLP